MARDLFNLDNFQEIEKGFDNQLNPVNPFEREIKKAKIMILRGQYNEAISDLQKIIDKDFNNFDAHLVMLCALSHDYSNYSNAEIDRELQLIKDLFPDNESEELAAFIKKRNNHLRKAEMEKEAALEYERIKKEKEAKEKEAEAKRKAEIEAEKEKIREAISEAEYLREERARKARYPQECMAYRPKMIPTAVQYLENWVKEEDWETRFKGFEDEYDKYCIKGMPEANLCRAYKWIKHDHDKYKQAAELLFKTEDDPTNTLLKYTQFWIGYIYMYGLGITQDYQKAYNYFDSAFKSGVAYAKGFMGILYLGQFVKNNQPHDRIRWDYFSNIITESINIYAVYEIMMWLHKNGEEVIFNHIFSFCKKPSLPKGDKYYRYVLLKGIYHDMKNEEIMKLMCLEEAAKNAKNPEIVSQAHAEYAYCCLPLATQTAHYNLAVNHISQAILMKNASSMFYLYQFPDVVAKMGYSTTKLLLASMTLGYDSAEAEVGMFVLTGQLDINYSKADAKLLLYKAYYALNLKAKSYLLKLGEKV